MSSDLDKWGSDATRELISPDEISRAWARELPGVPVESIPVITTLWRVSKLLADERSKTLRRLKMDAGTLDLLSTLRRSGTPYRLTTRELSYRCLVTAGAISQRVARAEKQGFVIRQPVAESRSVVVELAPAGHRYLEPAVTALLEHERDLLTTLTPAQQSALVDLLGSISASVLKRSHFSELD